MYKIKENGIEIVWQPIDKNLGFAIVQEVTGKKGTEEKPVLVDKEQAERIRNLYKERNDDPKEPSVEPKPDPNAKIEKELEDFKIQSAMAQAEIYEKLESDKLILMSALAESFEANLGGK